MKPILCLCFFLVCFCIARSQKLKIEVPSNDTVRENSTETFKKIKVKIPKQKGFTGKEQTVKVMERDKIIRQRP
ncbi:MAG: hypothetical protein JWN76_571 [Chitinophagaceae bacterium]|nr:hypothetical protein [Chitinophagaceae bacterium]